MLLTLLVLVPLLTGLLCWPLRERVLLERLNLLAFAIIAALAVWLPSENFRTVACGSSRRWRAGKTPY